MVRRLRAEQPRQIHMMPRGSSSHPACAGPIVTGRSGACMTMRMTRCALASCWGRLSSAADQRHSRLLGFTTMESALSLDPHLALQARDGCPARGSRRRLASSCHPRCRYCPPHRLAAHIGLLQRYSRPLVWPRAVCPAISPRSLTQSMRCPLHPRGGRAARLGRRSSWPPAGARAVCPAVSPHSRATPE